MAAVEGTSGKHGVWLPNGSRAGAAAAVKTGTASHRRFSGARRAAILASRQKVGEYRFAVPRLPRPTVTGFPPWILSRPRSRARRSGVPRSVAVFYPFFDAYPPWTSPSNPNAPFLNAPCSSTSSAIREILKVTERPDVISFAGGLPAPGGFPGGSGPRRRSTRYWFRNGRTALQYGPTEGYAPAARLGRRGPEPQRRPRLARPDPDRFGLAAGAGPAGQGADRQGQQGAWSKTPSYLGALQSVQPVPAALRNPVAIRRRRPDPRSPHAGQLAQGARFLYALPNFQNPTGRTLNRAAPRGPGAGGRARCGAAHHGGRPLRRAALRRRAAAQPAGAGRRSRRQRHPPGHRSPRCWRPACAWATSPPRAT